MTQGGDADIHQIITGSEYVGEILWYKYLDESVTYYENNSASNFSLNSEHSGRNSNVKGFVKSGTFFSFSYYTRAILMLSKKIRSLVSQSKPE